MKRSEVQREEYPEYRHYFIQQCPDTTIEEGVAISNQLIEETLRNLSEEEANFRYAPNKWSIKEVVIHMIDVEQIFNFRALKISRNDFSPIIGFDQNEYIEQANADRRSFVSIIDEFRSQRAKTLDFYSNMEDEVLLRINQEDNMRSSARAMAFFQIGHIIHHTRVIQEKYLSALNLEGS